VVSGQWSVKPKSIDQSKAQNLKSKIERGFSLLELMIAMFVMIILLSVALPTFQRSVRQARETVLKENLFQMRRAIDQYAADKGKLPQSLDDLKTGEYLREIPVDPLLTEKDEKDERKWKEIIGEDKNSVDGEQGIVDVKSTAEGEDGDGKKYEDY
jgi:general secretion pathway protein G